VHVPNNNSGKSHSTSAPAKACTKYVSHVQGEIWAKEFRGVIAGSEKELEGAALIHDFEFDKAFGQDRELEYEEESKTSLTLPVPLAVPQFHVRVGLIVVPLAESSWRHCQCRRRPEPGTGTGTAHP